MYLDFFFFFNDTATTEIYTLSLHDALPIFGRQRLGLRALLAQLEAVGLRLLDERGARLVVDDLVHLVQALERVLAEEHADRKSTRLNSSHANISYAVFCLKKKTTTIILTST